MAQHKKAPIKPIASPSPKICPSYILIVEDEPTQAALIRRTIRVANPNVKVKMAGSLQEYRSAIASSLPDIVLMDINLPDGKAFEVLISPLEAGPFPIVVMTGYGNEKIAVKAMKKGALDYVVKSPEAFKTIPRTLERALREWKLIQERKRAEEALHASELRFYTLYENVTVGLYRTTPAGKILMANRALIKMLGYSSFEKLAERNLAKVGFERTAQRKVFLRQIEMEGEVKDFESTWIRQDGSLLIVRESACAIRDSFGKTLYYDGVAEDITERRLAEVGGRNAEDALRESEEKFRSITENLSDVVFLTDVKGIITYISPAVQHVFGCTGESMQGHFFGEYLDETELQRVLPIFEAAIRNGIPTKNLSLLAKRRDGNTFQAELDASNFVKDGNILGTIGVIQDISERKRVEEALRESEDKFKYVFKYSPVGKSITLPSGEIDVNMSFCELLGYTQEELRRKKWQDITHPDDIGMTQSAIDLLLSGEQESVRFVKRFLHKNGSTVWVDLSSFLRKDNNGKPLYLITTLIDITERKRAEELIVRALHEWQNTFDSTNDAMWILDKDERIIRSNRTSEFIFQRSNEDVIGKHCWEIVYGTTQPIPECPVQRAKKSLHRESLELQIGKGWFEVLVDPILDATGQYDGAVHIVSNITERKKAAEALRSSEEKYRLIFENNPVPMWVYNIDTLAFLAVNDFAIDHYGYSREEFLSMTIKDIRPPEDIPYLQEVLKKHTEQLRKVGTARHRKKDDSLIDVEITGHEIAFEGHKAMFVLALDVTERKRAEGALRQSEAQLTAFMNFVPALILIKDHEFRPIFANEKYNSLFPINDWMGKKPKEIFPPEVADLMIQKDAEAMEKGYTNYEEIWIDRQGEQHIFYTQKFKIAIPESQPLLGGIISDITDRKRAEDALRNSEEKFRKAFMTSPDSININRLNDGAYVSINQGFTRIMGYTEEDILGKTSIETNIWVDLGDRNKLLEGLKTNGVVENLVARFRSKAGEIKYGMMSASIIVLDGIQHILSITRDITERKQAEEQLTQSRDLLTNLSRLVPGVIYQYRLFPDGHSAFPYSSPGINDIYEVTPEEVREDATPVFGRLHPDDYDYVANAIQESARTLDEFYSEFRVNLPRQGLRWRWCQAHPERMADGGTLWHGIISDITERKQAEEALRASESQFRELWGATVEGIVILDKGIIVEVNEAMCQMFGYTREQSIGISMLEFAPIEMHDRLRERIALGIEGRFETPALRADGTRMLLEIFAKRIIYKDKSVRMVATRDITEQRQVEDALRESEERMRAIVEGTPHLFFYTQDVDANTTYVSPTVEQITGYSADIWLKRKDWFITKAQFNQNAKEKTFAHLRGEFSKEPTLLEVCHANGNPILLEAYEYPIIQKGKVIGLQGVAHDITERRKAEDALRQMQKLDGLGTLAGGIAHDFNNILGIILAYSAHIKRFKSDTKQVDHATDTIIKAVDRGRTLVDQILTFARKSGTEFGPVNVTEVVMEIMTMIIETFPKVLTYSQNFDKDIPIINADRSQLHQALLNLCVNARDAMPNGGVLTINTRMVSDTSLHNLPPDALEGSYVCIEVIDTGEGMTDEIRKRIFEPFFTTKEKGKGTGLGLAVVFGIVQTHKGFVDVESEFGKGTAFRMYIPASEAAAPMSIEVGETIEELPGGKEILLVVEDELNLRIPLLKILSEKGYTVLSADNGMEGAKIYEDRNKDIALVITDLGLPKMSGMDLCKRIKLLNPSARIVVATGYLAPEIKLEFQKAGIQNILFKPYNAKKVLKVVRAVLDEK
ncbi:MAG: PAS domain S-box protein [Ignavibacteriales bacterium]|nr:PAS domain S-box protein [Ignavibacteriales bacterium]